MNPRLSSVRRMDVDDEVAVKALAGRAFSPLANLSFPRSPDALIAERRGELVGAVVLRAFGLPGGRKSGVMTWLMTDPSRRALRPLVPG